MPLARSISIVAGAVACVMSGGAQSVMQERTLVAHDFESSHHGWLVSGDTGQSEPQLHVAGGHPGGYISHVDEALGENVHFWAPDSVLRALSTAEHGR